ncbi:MAG: hypothetical protein DRR11_07645 [Gammaproteobacteria bacterium]|nr:MAG: hypothetical protein DRR11_07645 [Gammaproteobacteria bacterium]RLA36652.1 MAG: hypothetical protein DRR15_04320 [Gammaproteobacteria bacterium]
MNDTDDSNFDDLMTAAADLATEVKPGRDLWPGIEQAIIKPVRPARTMWNTVWAQAAAVLILVGGSSGITYLAVTDGADVTTPVAGGPTLVFESASGSFGSQYNLGPDYLDAQRDLAGRLDDELDHLTPDVREAVVTNIAAIRTAIAEINLALAEDPDNVLLQELLLSTYREELTLMKQVNGFNLSAMRRDDI